MLTFAAVLFLAQAAPYHDYIGDPKPTPPAPRPAPAAAVPRPVDRTPLPGPAASPPVVVVPAQVSPRPRVTSAKTAPCGADAASCVCQGCAVPNGVSRRCEPDCPGAARQVVRRDEVVVPPPSEPPRQWVTDTAHPGWQGFGRIRDGWLVDVTEWRQVNAPVAASSPAVLSFGSCANGQCAAPTSRFGLFRGR